MIDQTTFESRIMTIGNIASQFVENFSIQSGGDTGLKTGLNNLDEFIGGFIPGELIVVSGSPAMGQTSFLESLALTIPAQQQIPVVYFSLAKRRWDLVASLLANEARLDRARLATGRLDQEGSKRIEAAREMVKELPLYINDSTGLSVDDIYCCLDEYLCGESEVKFGLIIIDYLQLMAGGDTSAPRQMEIETILSELKGFAISANIPIVLHSLLYPECRGVRVREPGQKPILADLMSAPETASINRYADTVMFFHRDIMYGRSGDYESDNGKLEIIIEKSRNNRMGSVYLNYDYVTGVIT